MSCGSTGMAREEASTSGHNTREKGEEVRKTLPEDLVEMIVARLPFPYIYKARGLSKSWLARFSAVSSQDDPAKKLLASSFQKQVSGRSENWDSFCLIFNSEEGLTGYSRASQSWRPLPSLSFLPQGLFPENPWRTRLKPLWIEGSLLYGFARTANEVYVGNILTRTWRQLPPCPDLLTQIYSSKLLSDVSSLTYKLILLCIRDSPRSLKVGPYSIHIYESKSDAWSSKDGPVNFHAGYGSVAYLDGVVYFVGHHHPQHLLALNVEEGTMEELRLSWEGPPLEKGLNNLLVCNGTRLIVVTRGFFTKSLQVREIDLESLVLLQMAEFFPAVRGRRSVGKEYTRPHEYCRPVSDGNCIFFREESGNEVLVYSVDRHEWICFPVPGATGAHRAYTWVVSSFQPGLTPFMPV